MPSKHRMDNAAALKRRRVQKHRPKTSMMYPHASNQFRFGGQTMHKTGDTSRQTTKNAKKGKTMHLAQSDRRIL